ncbi:MAG: MFS transporter, partial [Leptolyngbyaceae cyanobacterium CSU_1_3]|nr:MFS transporter [Leptolyngbyaceae cyanobacterium CSU_1_3]
MEVIPPFSVDSPEPITGTEPLFPLASEPEAKIPKAAIRQSLRASTLDGVFAAIFSNITGGVLLSNFLVELHASPIEIGLSASIPMVANLIQPLGAFWGDRTRSRHNYCFWIYAPSRLIWLLLLGGIAIATWGKLESHSLVIWTLAILVLTHFLGALGSASWLSWLAALVPRRLRGRYFSIRNSAANLTCLICVPLSGLMVSQYPRGAIEGYGVVLLMGVVFGLVSLAYQWQMTDVNPQLQKLAAEQILDKVDRAEDEKEFREQSEPSINSPIDSRTNQLFTTPSIDQSVGDLIRDRNFLRFLLYFSAWMFAVNLSAP